MSKQKIHKTNLWPDGKYSHEQMSCRLAQSQNPQVSIEFRISGARDVLISAKRWQQLEKGIGSGCTSEEGFILSRKERSNSLGAK